MQKNNLDWTRNHPVSNVQWIPIEKIHANSYNPNTVAPPEMRLLEVSIKSDGYTQPIVVWQDSEDTFEVVDGFHRHVVGKKMGLSHLPCVIINNDRLKKSDRMSSTIRHNRARGKHELTQMSDIVRELCMLGWSDLKICKNLGMDADEVLRLKQITGLTELFEDKDFSKAWEIEIEEE